LSRHIPEANASLRSGKWERERFQGTEVRGKTRGIVGLGQGGSEVARRAKGLEMRVLAHDPFGPEERARVLGVDVVPMEKLVKESDYITVHTTLTEGTKRLIGEAELRAMKPSARVINTARGGIVDEAALKQALDEGWIAGAAIDVWEKEPLTSHPLFESDKVVVTPHLGASTAEAQERVAVDVAEQIMAVLRGEPARYAVNAPLIPAETYSYLAPYVPVAFKAGELAVQLHDGPHIVSIDGFWVDVPPSEGYLLLVENKDRPGMVGAVGTLMGEYRVNISFMNVGRHEKRGTALMVLALDETLTPEQIARVK